MENYCTRCGKGTWACACDLSYRDRLLTVQLSPQATPTRTKTNYYDRSAVAEAFGEDSRERYFDETAGRGAVIRRNGTRYVRDPRTKEYRVATGDDIGFFLGDDKDELGSR